METPVTELLQKLSIQQDLLSRQKRDLQQNENQNNVARGMENRSSSSSSPTDPFPATTPPTESAPSDGLSDTYEVFKLKRQLEDAQDKVAQMELQITQSRLVQHTMEEAIGSPFPNAQHLAANITGHNMLPGAHGIPPSTYGNSRAPITSERSSFNLPQVQQRPP